MDSPEPVSAAEGDQPSECERLQVKCLRLENKVKTLKDVSSIRKNLLEIRERESKDLIRRLDAFELNLNNEKKLRFELKLKLKEAESECEHLAHKLTEKNSAMDQAKTFYEKRLRSMAIQLDESAESLQKAIKEKDAQGEKLKKVLAESELSQIEMDTKFEDMKQTTEERNQVIDQQNADIDELKMALEMALEENSKMRQEMLKYVEERTLQVQQGLNQNLVELNLENEVSRNSVDILKRSELENCHSTTSDVQDLIQKLEKSEAAELVQSSEHSEVCRVSGVDTSEIESRKTMSISRTFAKLQNLIVEKKALQSEIYGLKQLEKKLESKVDRQSRRLYVVSLEVNKTWRLVSKLRAQCGQLHTSKSVHRYELQEKRRFVEKLKKELGASRQKWMKLNEKNVASQLELDSIRDEFARRRAEVCQSRESAFFEDSCSTPTSSVDGDHFDAEDTQGTSTSFEDDSIADLQIKPVSSVSDTELPLDDDGVPDLPSDLDQEMTEETGARSSYEELIERRSRRLLQLEEECHLLFSKLKVSRVRNATLAFKLANLHNHYGPDNHSEDSALEGDETELLSEASGDTAYASRSGDTALLNGENEDDTESPTDIDEVIVVGGLQQSPSEEIIGQSGTNLASDENIICSTETVLEHHSQNNEIRESLPTVNSSTSLAVEDAVEDDLTSMCSEAECNYSSNPNVPVALHEFSAEDEDDEQRSGLLPFPMSVHSLSRIIIQQLPRCLALLKKENCSLKRTVEESGVLMKETELKLEEQRGQVAASVIKEMELRNELDLKQRLIRELTTKIQIATENYQAINEEHGQMSEYIQIKIQDTKIQEQRKLVKMRNLKNCSKCKKKFSLFKRKVYCNICGYSFCGDCLFQQDLQQSPIERERKKLLICEPCDERKRKLDAVVQEHFRNLRM